MENTIHQGRNIKRFREMLGMKQEALAIDLGEDWTQKKVSLLETKEFIEDDLRNRVAAILQIPIEAIEKFNDETAINIISTTFNNNDYSSSQIAHIINYTPTFNPLEKLTEALDENRKLYERLLQAEQEKVQLLEKMMSGK